MLVVGTVWCYVIDPISPSTRLSNLPQWTFTHVSLF